MLDYILNPDTQLLFWSKTPRIHIQGLWEQLIIQAI